MSDEKMSESPAVMPARKRRSWVWSAVLALVVFGAGGITGGGLTMIAIHRHLSDFIRNPNDAPDRVMPWLKRRLGLDEEQTAEVEKIVRAHHRNLQAIRRETVPKVRKELEATQTEVSAVLKPGQRELWNKRMTQMQNFWFPALPEGPLEEKASESAGGE